MFAARKTDNVSSAANYIEDVFSTYLYTGDGTNKTLNLGIDLAGKGGLTWIKSRNNLNTVDHLLFDTARGNDLKLSSNLTAASQNQGAGCWSPTSTGFTVNNGFQPNYNGTTYVSWTFREQAKFFDVVTYTGNGSNGRVISHSLGSSPGCIIIKRTDSTGNWVTWHRALPDPVDGVLYLNTTNAQMLQGWFSSIGSTSFTISSNSEINASGGTYVAYLFAHDAGGFGAAGTDNVISCGAFTTDGSGNATINLGYEPQWILLKTTGVADAWYLYDTMRGITAKDAAGNAFNAYVSPNSANAETTTTGGPWSVNQTGFQYSGGFSSRAFIYIAIRRGPMKTPTSGTSVFAPVTRTGTGAAVTVTGAGFPPDFLFNIDRFGTGPAARYNYDRLRGAGQTDLRTNSAAAEGSAGAIGVSSFDMNGFSIPSTGISFLNSSSASYINYFFGRAPGFFDVVCYTGTGSALAVNHNLQVVPELVIWKARNQTAFGWKVTCVGLTNPNTYYLTLNSVNGETDSGGNFIYNRTATAVTFAPDLTQASYNNVVYLFATCPGVSKVGSYTGNGSSQTINCGFAAGARFILIKRTDSTGDWYVWDSARGISSSTDPYLTLNTTAAEVTSTNWVDTASTGFQVTAAGGNLVNTNGASYIFLSVA